MNYVRTETDGVTKFSNLKGNYKNKQHILLPIDFSFYFPKIFKSNNLTTEDKVTNKIFMNFYICVGENPLEQNVS